MLHATVHCEASLMGMIVAHADDMVPLPNGVKREELRAIKVTLNCIYLCVLIGPADFYVQKVLANDGVSAIGVGKKCCWCCSSLAHKLSEAHPRISSQVPASHGLIFPWELPTIGIGISLPVAQSMENEISRREVGKFIEQLTRATQSAMSSPAVSILWNAPDMIDPKWTQGSLGLHQ